ncbi:hypothetical protein ABZ825_34395 [Streptomyces tauricus]|uniref:hypothetical protein n=1 Tax=Streptomyces tauricus TaxID=68274 RepID=UPI0033D58061
MEGEIEYGELVKPTGLVAAQICAVGGDQFRADARVEHGAGRSGEAVTDGVGVPNRSRVFGPARAPAHAAHAAHASFSWPGRTIVNSGGITPNPTGMP